MKGVNFPCSTLSTDSQIRRKSNHLLIQQSNVIAIFDRDFSDTTNGYIKESTRI